jgi:hypothetical protein
MTWLCGLFSMAPMAAKFSANAGSNVWERINSALDENQIKGGEISALGNGA